LTGLYNRRKLTEEIKGDLKAQSEFGLAILDIDDFKKINDTYGHPIGDIILKEIGQILRDNLGEYLVGRLGGDEFVILIENVQIINIVIQKLELTCNQIAKIKIEEHPDIVAESPCSISLLQLLPIHKFLSWMHRNLFPHHIVLSLLLSAVNKFPT